jgi:hypothetical protein
MRQAFNMSFPHNFAILWGIFSPKNEVITENMPNIIVKNEINVQQYKLKKKFNTKTGLFSLTQCK